MEAYKFRSIENLKRDLKSLVRNQIYAPKFIDLNDPFEGVYNEQITNLVKSIEKIHSVNSSAVIKNWEDVISYKSFLGIYSLSLTYSEELLWAHYASSYNGYCIEYDIDQLKNNYLTPKTVNKFLVDYQPKLSTITTHDIEQDNVLKKLYATKSRKWICEKEIRLIYDTSSIKNYHPSALLSICFGMNLSKKHRQKIIKSLINKNITFYEIYREPNSYKLERRPINKNKVGENKRHLVFFKKREPIILPEPEKDILLSQNWRLPVDEEYLVFGKIIKKTNISGCGDYRVKRMSPNKYLIACFSKVDKWVYYILDKQLKKISIANDDIIESLTPPE